MSVKSASCWFYLLLILIVIIAKGSNGNEGCIIGEKPTYMVGSSKSSLAFNTEYNYWIATYSCKFVGDAHINISWHYTGHRVPSGNSDSHEVQYHIEDSYTQSTLHVKRFTGDLDVQYSCLAVNCHGYDSHDLWLESSPILDIALLNKNYYDPGDTIKASCNSFPDSTLFWQLPGDMSLRSDLQITLTTVDSKMISDIEVVLNVHDNDANFRCCAVSSDPRKKINPFCESFAVKVSHPPTVTYSINCPHVEENDGDECNPNLNCKFSEFPPQTNRTVAWHLLAYTSDYLAGEVVDEYEILENFTNVVDDDESITTNLEMLQVDLNLGQYTCLLADGNDSLVSHTFLIDGSQSFINVVNISRLSASENVTLQCVFIANPISNAYWIIEDIGATNGWKIINSTENQYRFELVEEGHDFSFLYLYINPFTSRDVARYSCLVNNSLATLQSEWLMLEVMPEISKMDLLTPTNVSDGDLVTIACSVTSDVAPEKITWRLMSEYDISYNITTELESDGNIHTSKLEFTADWKSNFVWFKCGISFGTAPSAPVFQNEIIHINYEPKLLETKDCNLEAMNISGECQLQCTAQTDANYKFIDERWIYFGGNESQSITFPGKLFNNSVPHRLKMAYTPKKFSAGTYQCQINYRNINSEENVTVKHNFKIEPNENGIPINGSCSSSQQCLALNSECNSGICTCLNQSSIYAGIACLHEEAHYGGDCKSDNECSQATEKAICDRKNHHCVCPEGYVYNKTSYHRCIFNVSINDQCAVDEECLQATKLSYCVNSTCQCSSNYHYDVNESVCVAQANTPVQNPEKVTTGSIIGILLLVIIVVAVAGAVISTSLKKYRKKQRRLKAQQAANVNLEDMGPANMANQRVHATDNNYWYNPHQPVRLNMSTASRA